VMTSSDVTSKELSLSLLFCLGPVFAEMSLPTIAPASATTPGRHIANIKPPDLCSKCSAGVSVFSLTFWKDPRIIKLSLLGSGTRFMWQLISW
jgi:hypothetical protein